MISGMKSLRLGWAAVLGLAIAAGAIASTDPVKDTRQIMAGTVTTKTVKQAYLSGAKDGTAAFQGALAAYKAVRAAEVPVPAPTPAPAPVPVPTPVTWAQCAAEGSTCSIVGTANVRYGAGTAWAIKSVTGSVACSNNVFGDPIVGTVKHCETDGIVAPAPGPAPAPVPIPSPPAPPPAPSPGGRWVSAPLAVGGYAIPANAGPCCAGGPVLRLTAFDGAVWTAIIFVDPSGNFPTSSPYWSTAALRFASSGLAGVAPAS